MSSYNFKLRFMIKKKFITSFSIRFSNTRVIRLFTLRHYHPYTIIPPSATYTTCTSITCAYTRRKLQYHCIETVQKTDIARVYPFFFSLRYLYVRISLLKYYFTTTILPDRLPTRCTYSRATCRRVVVLADERSSQRHASSGIQ